MLDCSQHWGNVVPLCKVWAACEVVGAELQDFSSLLAAVEMEFTLSNGGGTEQWRRQLRECNWGMKIGMRGMRLGSGEDLLYVFA